MKATAAKTLALFVLFTSACSKGEKTVEPLPVDEPPKRAAASFVHCVEAQAAGCVQSTEPSGGAHALLLLSWLADGTPLSILASAQGAMATHADGRKVQAEFVERVERHASTIRGAECDPLATQPAAALATELAKQARGRLEALGLLAPNAGEIVDALAREVGDDLQEGHVVTMQCRHDPFRLHLVTRQRGDLHEVVGLSTLIPELERKAALSDEQVEARLQGGALGLGDARAMTASDAVHPYLPFPMEAL